MDRDDEPVKLIRPDVAVSQIGEPGGVAMAAGVATLEPVTVPLFLNEEIRESRIAILHRPDRTLVAVLELLSPANKEMPGRSSYLFKRAELLEQPVHLVELDLLLGGRRLPFAKDLPPGDFFAMIARVDRRFNCDVYAWTLRQTLPTIPIPLRAPDPDILVDLAAVFAQTYDRGRYAASIDYRADPKVSLTEETLNWVRTQAKSTT